MAVRKPLVQIAGSLQELPAGDTLLGAGSAVDAVRTPVNVTPAVGATNVLDPITLTGSVYLSLYGLGMAAAQWQVATAADFVTMPVNTGDVVGTAITRAIASGVLGFSTQYFWRVRYKDSDGVYSPWSPSTAFTTAAAAVSFIATPAATPAAYGDPFEGGFYAGMIWNELVQSASSTVIGTGSKIFTVPDMTAVPLVYSGQVVEVRSRANPANKMIGTVTNAVGTALTLNISSVVGSGTFTDWSVMARYRVLVAPKTSGESASIALKNASDALPLACQTLTEGYKATLAMTAAGTSTVYPAAWFCKNLSIAGKTDWYVPSRDELMLCWRNLKPTAENNFVGVRPKSTINYANLGSVDDIASEGHGKANNSDPVSASQTLTDPAQVAAGKNFRTGESDAFIYATIAYWSSSESAPTTGWSQNWYTGYPGAQNTPGKTLAMPLRAVRRSII